MDARLRSVGMIAVFYIAAPLVTYSQLRSHGFSMVTALVLLIAVLVDALARRGSPVT